MDLSHLIAGPFCTMLLSDNGADVIKVEPPTGDIARSRPPRRGEAGSAESISALFSATNRGKRSIVIDLKTEAGHQTLTRLIELADVLVENFRPGVLTRLGFDLEELAASHPSLIIASMSAYGESGITSDDFTVPGVAIVAEATSGLTRLAKDRKGRPIWLGFPFGDLASGVMMYAAITTALVRRLKTGEGGRLDLSMAECALAFNAIEMAKFDFLHGGASYDEPLASPFGVFPASDGFVVIGVNTDDFWRRLCSAMQRPDVAADARLSTIPGRARLTATVSKLVGRWTSARSTHELISTMQSHGVPCALVATAEDVLRDPRYLAREALWRVPDGLGGEVTLPANPMRFTGTAPGPVPRLGQHTKEILDELGPAPKLGYLT